MKKYAIPFSMLAIFEIVAVTLWLTKDNIFYLFNFSYIGISISLAVFLYIRKYKHARRIAQLLVGLYMLVYLGFICGENMRSKDSGTIFLPVYLKRQLSIMQLQKYLDHCSLGEGGAVMPAGRR